MSIWGDIMSISGGYDEYIRRCSVHRGCSIHWGIPWVHQRVHEYIGGVHEYIGGCSMHRRDTMSTLEDIMNTFWGDILMHLEDTMSTLGDVQYIGGYH